MFSSTCGATIICYEKSCKKNHAAYVVMAHYLYHQKGVNCLEAWARGITAHELGHMFGLRHEGTGGKDLMMWGAGQIITKKTAAAAKKYYKKYLKKKLN